MFSWLGPKFRDNPLKCVLQLYDIGKILRQLIRALPKSLHFQTAAAAKAGKSGHPCLNIGHVCEC